MVPEAACHIHGVPRFLPGIPPLSWHLPEKSWLRN